MHDAHAIEMRNHLSAPEVADFLAREGEKYATRLVEHDGQRFFVIQDSARRPSTDKISQPEARLPDMDAEGIGIQTVSCAPFVMYPDVAPDLGLAIAQVNNDALTRIGQRLPERFVPLVSVPLQDPLAEGKALGLAPDAEAAVLYGNARRLLRLT